MDKLELAIKYLKQIAEYDVADNHGYVDEWNEAGSFNEVQQMAEEALKELI